MVVTQGTYSFVRIMGFGIFKIFSGYVPICIVGDMTIFMVIFLLYKLGNNSKSMKSEIQPFLLQVYIYICCKYVRSLFKTYQALSFFLDITNAKPIRFDNLFLGQHNSVYLYLFIS